MVTMLQGLDARGFFFRSLLSVCGFLALFFKIFWNRLSCHSLQCGRTISFQAVQFWPFRDNEYTTKRDGPRHIEVSGPMKIAGRLSHAVGKKASHATREPHNHQNHNNCSKHTHT